VVLVLAACSKQGKMNTPTPNVPASAAVTAAPPSSGSQPIATAPFSAPPAVPRPADVQPVSGPVSSDSAAVLGMLTQALRKYSAEHQRVPVTFSEVVAAGYVKGMPSAPAGKKFSINAKRVEVVLINQ
jgi:hypothetical protein